MDTKQLIEGLQALTEIADMSDYDCEQFEKIRGCSLGKVGSPKVENQLKNNI